MFEGQCARVSSSDLKPRVGSSRVKSQAVECMCVHLCPVVRFPWGMLVGEE